MVKHLGVADRPGDIGFYIGLLATAFYSSQGIAHPFWGRFSDVTGRRKPFLLIGIFCTTIGYLWLGLSASFTSV
jgi:MFS family permease